MNYNHVNYRSAVRAGIAGVIVMTIVLAFFGMNILWGMGVMMGAWGAGAYVVGIALYVVFGIVYGLIYACFFEKWLRSLPRALAGATYALVPFIIGLLFFGSFVDSLQGVFRAPSSERTCGFEEEKQCASGCDLHKKMPYNPPVEERTGFVMMPCGPMEGHKEMPRHNVFCFCSFFGNLVFGISLALLYRSKRG